MEDLFPSFKLPQLINPPPPGYLDLPPIDHPPPRRKLIIQAPQTGEVRNGAHLFKPLQGVADAEQDYWRKLDGRDGDAHLPGDVLGRASSASDDGDDFDGCRCTEIDFHRLLDKGGSEEHLCSLQHAMECSDCALCGYIATFANKHFSPAVLTSRRKVKCLVKRVITTPDEFPQRAATDRYPRLLLIMRDQAQGTSIRLDRVGLTPNFSTEDVCTLYRRPIRRYFDPRLLRSWLQQSDRSEALRDQLQSPQQISSFEDILKVGKFRLIDVVQNKIITTAQLLPFIALSYVWGRSMAHYAAASVNSNGISSRPVGEIDLSWDTLPRTVRDAICVTHAIGQKYLWVDSLCIDQFDAAEKGFLISQMGNIFANAYLTIVAAEGEDADAGLCPNRYQQSDELEEHTISLQTGRRSISLLPAKSDSRQAIIRSYWSSRGWTLQERLLSRRCVFFTDDQVYFQDAEVQVSEAYDLYRPNVATGLQKHAQNNESFDMVGDLYFRILSMKGLGLGQYDQAIREYTKRTLSHSGDRFDAFMGISEFFQPPGLPLEHILALNALPLKFFTNALRWRHDEWKDAPKRIRMDARNSRHLPSWSWVGWEGEVSGPFHYDPFANPATILDSANVLCMICNAPSDFSAQICEPSQPAHVTLHLYAPSVTCSLHKHHVKNEFFIKCGSRAQICLTDSIKLDEYPQSDWEFELVRLAKADFWLLRVDGTFAERIAFVDPTEENASLVEVLHGRYFRIR